MLARVPRRATARQGNSKLGQARVARGLVTRSLFPLPLGGPRDGFALAARPARRRPSAVRERVARRPQRSARVAAVEGAPRRGGSRYEGGRSARTLHRQRRVRQLDPPRGHCQGARCHPDHAQPRTQARTSGTAAAANSRAKKTCRRAGAEAPGGAARAIRALRAPLTHQRPVPALGGARGRARRCNSRRSSAALQRTPGSPVYTSASLLQVDDTMSFSSQPSLLMAGAPATRAAKCPLRSEPAQHRTRPHRRDRDPRRGRRSAETL